MLGQFMKLMLWEQLAQVGPCLQPTWWVAALWCIASGMESNLHETLSHMLQTRWLALHSLCLHLSFCSQASSPEPCFREAFRQGLAKGTPDTADAPITLNATPLEKQARGITACRNHRLKQQTLQTLLVFSPSWAHRWFCGCLDSWSSAPLSSKRGL